MKTRLFIMIIMIIVLLCTAAGCFAADNFEPGIRTDADYTNESLGIRIDLGKNYVMATEEELREMMGVGIDMLEVDIDSKILEQAANYFDMMAANPNDGSSVMVMAEKLMLSGITVDQYIEAYSKNMKDMYNAEVIEQGKEEFCGNEWNYAVYVFSVQNINLEYVTFFLKAGNRVVSMTFSGLSDESLNNAFGLVSCYSN